MSAWNKIFGSGNDQALITVCGLDHQTFNKLNHIFKPLFDRFTPFHGPGGTFCFQLLDGNQYPGGRPRSVTSEMCLGMCLMWSRTRGSNWNLGIIFGTTSSTTHAWIKFGRKLIVSILCNHDEAKVKLPSPQMVQVYKMAINQKHCHLHDFCGVVDELRLCLQQAGDAVIQEKFYGGWKKDHFVGNIFAFAPDGTIFACSLNAPGSWHDSYIAEIGGVYRKLEQLWNMCHGRVVMDSAFPKKDWNIISGHPNPEDGELVQQEATSLRQSAEWGMRAFQGSFPRVKDHFIYEEQGERLVYLQFITLLYNFRAQNVGLNQIQSVYMPYLNADANGALGMPPAVEVNVE